MKHLHYFENQAAYNQARENNYIEPWVSWTAGQGLDYNYNEQREWNKQKKNPLTLEIISPGKLYMYTLYNVQDMKYRISGGNWVVLYSNGDRVGDYEDFEPTVQTGDIVEYLGTNPNGIQTDDEDGRGFFGTGWGWNNDIPSWQAEAQDCAKFNVRGNVLSLIDQDNYQNITSASQIPNCWGFNLFHWCSAVVDARMLVLPILDFGESFSGYGRLFYGAKNLTKAPILPTTTLTNNCYTYMFSGCTSLTTAPVLPATTLANSCYAYMFSGCTGLINAPNLPATTLASSCYYGMFYGCTSLTTAPELPATTLADSCYYSVFSGCTSLTEAPDLPATTLANNCYLNMFIGCTSLTEAPELPATTLTNYCYSYMFSGCTSLTTAPVLPATTLVSGCYNYMFRNCSSLNYIKAMFTTTPNNTYTNNWVKSVAATGTFVKNSAAEWNVTSVSGIPSGWTVETAVE